MKRNENICKFVNTGIREGITTYTFVYEKIAENTENLTIPYKHTIYLVTDGTGKLITENGEKKLKAGNIFFTFKQVPFRIYNVQNLQYMYISFDGGRAEDLFARFGISPVNSIFEGYKGLTAFWENSIIKAGEKNLDLISESVLLYTLGEMVPPEIDTKQQFITDILKFIEENFKNGDLNLNTVAEHFGYNSKYFSHMFKKEMGITFSEYLTNIRIQHAVFLIEQNVTSVKNIALLSGYNDPHYFSNVFKLKTGISPKEFVAKKQSK